ncbi:hypothetical protein H072_5109 [Dactylellina haptotyla CBS 200.50]|uniref:Uncharacterized protein n=1 Tax=Dactylellina haptotyla (strain CBS 200.50) TaxID=1284197 RepID=S8ADE7_DACHA|nr:hypothetical protein H072_5109 [Dactylellina haptotyla CBS 200.50]
MNREGVLWFGLGITCVLAYKLTVYQLESFKRQCEILPEESRETVDKATENALKLETLSTLSRGVNYNLSRAAVRIIAERALTEPYFSTLLRSLRSPQQHTRHASLKTLRFLILGKSKTEAYYENDNDHVLSKEAEAKLYSQPVFNALVRSCIFSLPRTLPDGTVTRRDDEAEAYALECLCTLIRQPGMTTITRALEAGIVTYMKLLPCPGYANIVAAFTDREFQPDNYFLLDIHNWMIDHDQGEEYLEYLKKEELYVERPKVILGMRNGMLGGSGSFETNVQIFHRTLRERYPDAVSVEQALEFAAAEGMTFEEGGGERRAAFWQ